jgi:hypothetical protein
VHRDHADHEQQLEVVEVRQPLARRVTTSSATRRCRQQHHDVITAASSAAVLPAVRAAGPCD